MPLGAVIYPIFILLFIFQLKHFICDFLLQIGNKYMFRKFDKTGWVKPLAAHAGIHALTTWLISHIFLVAYLYNDVALDNSTLIYTPIALAAYDFIIHFIMDRIKASPNLLGNYKIEEKGFWYSLGVDQAVHHLTHYSIIFILMWTLVNA